MRALLAAGLVAALAAPVACGSSGEATTRSGAAAETELRVTLWLQGRSGPSRSWTLRCRPAGGTLPRARRACSALAQIDAPFRPTARDAVCTQQYGGPAEGLVRGTYLGRRVWARFHRRDGCHISRWNRVRFLFPTLLVVDP